MTLERAALAALALAAVVLWAVAPTYPNYDAYYTLVWGRELLDGVTPSFEVYAAPTQHPGYIAIGAVLGLIGEHGERALVLLAVLSLVAMVAGVHRLGVHVLGRWPALAGAGFAAASFAFLLYAVRGYVDVPFLALAVWAAALAAAPRPRWTTAMALLALAGTLRPEGWVLAGLLWLWRIRSAEPRERVVLTALAAAGPTIWALTDLAVTGDPLFSLHSTSELADALGRDRGIADLPRLFVSYLADTVRPPVAALALAGLVLAWRLRERRVLIVLLALLAAGAATFIGTGVAGLSILPRYLTVPALALCLLAGYAWLGFTTLAPDHPWRERWRGAAIAAGVLGLAFAVTQLGSVGRLATELRFIRATHDDLHALLEDPAVRAGMRCGPLTFPTFRMVPDARWILDAPAERVAARSALRSDRGVAVFAVGRKPLRRHGLADGVSPLTNAPDPRFVRIARRGMFVAYSRCVEEAAKT